MKAQDLNTKTPDELKALLLDARKEQLNLRFQRSGGTLDNTSLIRNNRRLIARVKTLLNAANGNEKQATSAKSSKAKEKSAPKAEAKKAPTKKAAPKKEAAKTKTKSETAKDKATS